MAYPPLTPLLARVGLALFGPSLVGIRLSSALAQAAAMVLTGLIARELCGKRLAMVIAALAVAIAPVSFAMGTMLMYVSFDYLWWVLIAFLVLRLVNTENPRWWLAIGAAVGLGAMTKYTIAVFVAGLAAGVLLTRSRRYLFSPWLWAGAGVALLIFLPNIIWQIQHNFISLDFLGSIHKRDIAIGRADSFLVDQVTLTANPLTIPLWIAGLYFYFFAARGKPYRIIGWMAVVPFVLFFVLRGRGYYVGGLYPMLLAAGAVVFEGWLTRLSPRAARVAHGLMWAALALGAVIVLVFVLPAAPINSAWWHLAVTIDSERVEQVGWPELVEAVAAIYNGLPAQDRAVTGILTGNYGEAGAINLYGPAYGLPTAISGVNTYWLRGNGDPAPQAVIVLGIDRGDASYLFKGCKVAGHTPNPYHVKNEETTSHSDIYLCQGPRDPWERFWPRTHWHG